MRGLVGRYKDKASSFVRWSQGHLMGHLLPCELVLWQCSFNPWGVSRHPKSAAQYHWYLRTWQCCCCVSCPYLVLLSYLNLVCDCWRSPEAVLTEAILQEGSCVFDVYKLILHELLCKQVIPRVLQGEWRNKSIKKRNYSLVVSWWQRQKQSGSGWFLSPVLIITSLGFWVHLSV